MASLPFSNVLLIYDKGIMLWIVWGSLVVAKVVLTFPLVLEGSTSDLLLKGLATWWLIDYLLLSGKILQKRFLLATCFGPSCSKAWSTADSSTQSSLFINLLLLSPSSSSSSSICRHQPFEDWECLVTICIAWFIYLVSLLHLIYNWSNKY